MFLGIDNSPVALSIAGFDPGGGAGIITDIKTFAAFGVYGTAVIVTLTAQNHTNFLSSKPVGTEMLKYQLDSIFSGYDIKAVKTGLFTSSESMLIVADYLKNKKVSIVTDPVFSATSGKQFVNDNIIEIYKNEIFPLSSLITPNIDELTILTKERITNIEDLIKAGKTLNVKTGVPVLAKGGHLKERAVDVLINNDIEKIYESGIVKRINTHGSGCILSSAICANLTIGKDIESSVTAAKEFIDGLLRSGRKISKAGNILDPSI